MTGTSRGLRLNNPGDLRIALPLFHGEISPSADHEFRQFDTMENGIRAVAITLMTYYDKHNLKTLREMAYRYAPPNENDSGLYVETLADRTGFDPDSPLEFPTDLLAVTHAFIDAEQGDGVYMIDMAQFSDGVKSAIA